MLLGHDRDKGFRPKKVLLVPLFQPLQETMILYGTTQVSYFHQIGEQYYREMVQCRRSTISRIRSWSLPFLIEKQRSGRSTTVKISLFPLYYCRVPFTHCLVLFTLWFSVLQQRSESMLMNTRGSSSCYSTCHEHSRRNAIPCQSSIWSFCPPEGGKKLTRS